MLTEFDTSLPSTRQIQTLIKEAGQIEMKLITGDLICGKILWQDPQCMLVLNDSNERITIFKQAIAFLKTK